MGKACVCVRCPKVWHAIVVGGVAVGAEHTEWLVKVLSTCTSHTHTYGDYGCVCYVFVVIFYFFV